MASSTVQKGRVWDYFSLAPLNKAKCNVENCQAELSSTGGGTSTFRRHLESLHPSAYAEFLEKTAADEKLKGKFSRYWSLLKKQQKSLAVLALHCQMLCQLKWLSAKLTATDSTGIGSMVDALKEGFEKRFSDLENNEGTTLIFWNLYINDFIASSEEDDDDSASTENSSNIEQELQTYLKEKRIGPMECPLSWWKTNEAKYPCLAIAAPRYLSPPPTSVPSEQLFSGAGIVYEPSRNRLKGETVEKILFMKYNLIYTKFDF